jgi:hypothetical protein
MWMEAEKSHAMLSTARDPGQPAAQLKSRLKAIESESPYSNSQSKSKALGIRLGLGESKSQRTCCSDVWG